MTEEIKELIGRIESKAKDYGLTVDASFKMALANYSALLGSSVGPMQAVRVQGLAAMAKEIRPLKLPEVKFVTATVAVHAIRIAKADKLTHLNSEALFTAFEKVKLPPWDPTDPCTDAAKRILDKHGEILESDIGEDVTDLLQE